jgi:dephospho-CoA kinase
MLKVGVTGNIGSGKSTVCKIFESLKIPVFNADRQAKALYARPEIAGRVKSIFGADVFDENGVLNKQKLARLVFGDSVALQQLNGIIHPALMEVYREWLHRHAAFPYTVHEAAVIFENGLEKQFDFIINVSCPEDIRMRRIRERDGLSAEEIRKRMSRQWPEEEKNSRSDAVIVNDGKHLVIPQVMKIHFLFMQKQNKPI